MPVLVVIVMHVGHGVRYVGGDVLVQGAAKRHVQQLAATAYAQHGFARCDKLMQQFQFIAVARRVAAPFGAAGRCRRHAPVARLDHAPPQAEDGVARIKVARPAITVMLAAVAAAPITMLRHKASFVRGSGRCSTGSCAGARRWRRGNWKRASGRPEIQRMHSGQVHLAGRLR